MSLNNNFDPATMVALAQRAINAEHIWPEPKPIPKGLAAVDAFNLAFLPAALQPWIGDVSDRLQCPPDYVAVTAMVALGSVIGRRIGIKPQIKTDWLEVPNIWGGFIGRPGMLKSPAMQEALKPLHRLEVEAAKQNEIALEAYAAGMSEYKLRREVGIALKRKELKKAGGQKIDANIDIGEEPAEPKLVRYRTNDTSYEALGELLRDNPNGMLVERDELVSLLRHLDREDQVVARGFFLSAWSGQQSYSFDRIGRGHIHLEAVCIAVLGGTQPARISDYVRRSNAGGAGGDGLIQRFGLLVWPDVSTGWRNVDKYPDSTAREKVYQVFDRAAGLDMGQALRLGASKDQFDTIPHFRFDAAAHDDFLGWRTDLETRQRSGELPAGEVPHARPGAGPDQRHRRRRSVRGLAAVAATRAGLHALPGEPRVAGLRIRDGGRDGGCYRHPEAHQGREPRRRLHGARRPAPLLGEPSRPGPGSCGS
jgi:putative DNA primase/helicase